MSIEPGLTHEMTLTVRQADTAGADRSGLPEVFSTPRLVSWLEWTAHQAIEPLLAPGQASVGARVDIRHLAATPVGMQVRLRAELIEVDRRRLKFRVEAWDEVEKIAEGEHERFIIDSERFDRQVAEKREKITGG